jgi:hypothetical protein
VGRLLLAQPGSCSISFRKHIRFLFTMYITTTKSVKLILFFSLCNYFFIYLPVLCLYSHNVAVFLTLNFPKHLSRVTGFQDSVGMIRVANAAATKYLRYHEHLTIARLPHSHFSVVISAGNTTWFTLH